MSWIVPINDTYWNSLTAREQVRLEKDINEVQCVMEITTSKEKHEDKQVTQGTRFVARRSKQGLIESSKTRQAGLSARCRSGR